jgi:MFS family permease
VTSTCGLVITELRQSDPFVDVRLVRNRLVATADSAGFLISVAMYLCLPVVVEFIQVPPSAGYGFGVSVLVAGCTLFPVSVGASLSAWLRPAFQKRFGQRSMIPFGSLLYATAMVFFAFEHSALWEAMVITFAAGVAMGFTFAAMPAYIISAVGTGDTGSAMGFYQVLRSIGLAVGSAITSLILGHFTPAGEQLPDAAGFQLTLLCGAALCVTAAVITVILPGRHSALRPAPDDIAAENAELGSNAIPAAGAISYGPR